MKIGNEALNIIKVVNNNFLMINIVKTTKDKKS